MTKKMNIREITQLIRNKNYLFEITTQDKTFARKSNEEALREHGSLENYLHWFASLNKTSLIGIALYSRNGSSFKKRGFFLVDIPVVATTGSEVTTAPNTGQSCTALLVAEAQAELLRVRLECAEQMAKDLTRRNKELERKNSTLQSQVVKLLTGVDITQVLQTLLVKSLEQ